MESWKELKDYVVKRKELQTQKSFKSKRWRNFVVQVIHDKMRGLNRMLS